MMCVEHLYEVKITREGLRQHVWMVCAECDYKFWAGQRMSWWQRRKRSQKIRIKSLD